MRGRLASGLISLRPRPRPSLPLRHSQSSVPPHTKILFGERPIYKGFARLIHSFKGTIGLPINRIMHFYDSQKC